MESPQGEGTSVPKLKEEALPQATLQELFEEMLVNHGVSPEKAAQIASSLSLEQIAECSNAVETLLSPLQVPVFLTAIEREYPVADALAFAQSLTDTIAVTLAVALDNGHGFADALAFVGLFDNGEGIALITVTQSFIDRQTQEALATPGEALALVSNLTAAPEEEPAPASGWQSYLAAAWSSVLGALGLMPAVPAPTEAPAEPVLAAEPEEAGPAELVNPFVTVFGGVLDPGNSA